MCFFEELTIAKQDEVKIRGRGGGSGAFRNWDYICKNFQDRGKRPDLIDRLKMWEKRRAIEGAVAFRREEMSSGLEAVFDGRLDIREMIDSLVHKKELGHIGGGKMGGAGTELYELRQSALLDEWVCLGE